MDSVQINRIIENTSDGIIVINKQKGIEYSNIHFILLAAGKGLGFF